MKFIIDDAKILFNGPNNEAKALLTVTQWMGDKTTKPEELYGITLKGKMIDTNDLINNETILVKFIGEELIAFLKVRNDIYKEESLTWDEGYGVYRIGNYIFFNVKKDDSTVKAIKSIIEDYQKGKARD